MQKSEKFTPSQSEKCFTQRSEFHSYKSKFHSYKNDISPISLFQE